MADIATLGLAIDSRSAVQATKDLDAFSASGAKASASAELLARQNAQMAQSSKIAAAAAKDLSYAKEIQRQLDLEAAVAADKFMFKLAQEASQMGRTRAEILEMKAAMHGVSDGAQPFIDQIKKSEESLHKMNFATVGARRELLVLAHEASQGQWQRFGGSLMVLGERVDAMSMLFSAGGIAVSAAAVAVGAFAYRAYAAVDAQEKLSNALILTNNYSGQTTGSINSLAKSLSNDLDISTGKARDSLTQLAATGKFTGGELEQVGRLTFKLSRLTGDAAEDIVKDLSKMSGGVAKYAEEADSKYHFLNVAQMEHIQQLEELGQKHQATAELLRAWDSKLPEHTANIGVLKMAYLGWAEVLGDIDGKIGRLALKQVGKSDKSDLVIEEQKKLKELLDTKDRIDKNPFGALSLRKSTIDGDILKQRRVVHDAIEAWNQEEIKAGNDQNQQRIQEDAKNAQKRLDAYVANSKTALQKWDEESKKIKKDLEDANAGFIAAGEKPKYSAEDIQKAIDAAKPKPKSTTAIDSAEIDGEISAVERKIKLVETEYRDEQRIRAELRKAGEVSDSEFYAQEKKSRDKHLDDLIAYYEKERKVIERSMSNASDVKKKRLQTRLESLVDKQDELKSNKATDDRVDSIQSEAREKNKAQNIKHLTDMTNSYLDSLREQVGLERESNAIQVRAIGQGSMQTATEQRLNALKKQFQRDEIKLQRDLDTATSDSNKGGADKDFFEQKIAELRKQQEARKGTYEEMYRETIEGEARIREAQGDWTNGAKQSLANYADYAGNVASQTASMFQDGFRNMEDAVTNFAMTGKLNFHNFAEGVISDLIRIYIRQQMVGMVGSLKGFFGIGGGTGTGGASFDAGVPIPPTFAAKGATFSGGSITAFSKGGAFSNTIADTPTMAPMAVFGEAGPEAIMPLKRGPDGSLGIRATGTKQQSTSGDGIAIHTQINIASDGTAKSDSVSSGRVAESGKQIADMVNGLISKAMADQMRQGGLLWKMKNGQS